MFQCSEDFIQLGTLHAENRASEYYPLDKPQPLSYATSPLEAVDLDTAFDLQNTRGVKGFFAQTTRARSFNRSLASSNKKSSGMNTTSYQAMMSTASAFSPAEIKRQAHISNLMKDRKREELLRSKLITDEIIKLKPSDKQRGNSAQRREAGELLFPTTTNQAVHDMCSKNLQRDHPAIRDKRDHEQLKNELFTIHW